MEVRSAPDAIEYFQSQMAIARETLLGPPPDIPLDEWADTYRKLSSVSSARPGDWRTSEFEPARGIMRAWSDSDTRELTVMAPTQLVKTELINNIIGRQIHLDPCPMLLVLPSLDEGKKWSKERFKPMLRETDVLAERVRDPKSRDSENTLLEYYFPGGLLGITGAESPKGLASRPIKIVLEDEIDKYPASAGAEGDPCSLAEERTSSFWDYKIARVCSPTIKGLSRIEKSWEKSDQRHYYVACPHCGFSQRLLWKQVKWERDKFDKSIPETASFVCAECGVWWTEQERIDAIRYNGNWVASKPFNGHAGFHLNRIYSPWQPLAEMAKKHLAVKKDPELRKVFTNTQLAETYEEETDKLDSSDLLARREDWGHEAPEKAVLVTAGVDVQKNRLEVELVGWGPGEENWSLAYHVIPGDPSQEKVWERLDKLLLDGVPSSLGITLPVSCTCIDSGGLHTQEVFDFCRTRYERWVFPIAGKSQAGRPIAGRPTKSTKHNMDMYVIGVDAAKQRLMSRLRIFTEGAGYCHFPVKYEKEYFEMLTAEQQVTKYKAGVPTRAWVKTRARNEALDCRVYNMAALEIANVPLEQLYEDLRDITPPPPKEQESERGSWIEVNKQWL